MWYINIIAMKDIIIMEKAREKTLSKGSVDIIILAKVAQALTIIDFACRYR